MRWTLRSRLAEHPAYLRVARRRHGEAVVSEATELVIDGFTRSASTFAVVAFQLAQPRPVRVGHHLHAPGQIIRAVRLGVPVLLTVRPPEDTVLSLVVREPYVTIPQGLTAYARFHERLLAHRDAMVVADFAEVTAHLDRSIARVNARFGTEFAAFDPTPERTRECFDLIEVRSRRPPWSGAIHGVPLRARLPRGARAAGRGRSRNRRAARAPRAAPVRLQGGAQGCAARRVSCAGARPPAGPGGRGLRPFRRFGRR